VEDLLAEFRHTIEAAEKELLTISEAESEVRPAPDQWSAKEVLGHLIDSAANNHRRFVEAHWKEDLVFPGYDQERWVAVQGYRSRPWPELVALWKAYNMHLVHVVAAMPEEVLNRPRKDHSLDQIAWQVVDRETPVSLGYLIRDYLGHLRAHLEQIPARSV
jgi:anti-sigma-K factor RskA